MDAGANRPSPSDPCLGVTCTGHGTCGVTSSDVALCVCNEGYHAQGLDCLSNTDPCAGIDCAWHGSCDAGTCTCFAGYTGSNCAACAQGYEPQGSACVASSTPYPTALPEPFDAGVVYTRELHVSAGGGNDDAGDGSAGAPFATIGRAVGEATPGTRIVVAAGTYAGIGWREGLQGDAESPIAIVGEGEVIIDGGGTAMAAHLVEPHYLVLEGLTIQNAFPHGMNIDDGGTFDTPAHHVILRDITIRNVGDGHNNDCLKMSGVDDFMVLDSDMSGCNAGEIIDMVGCHRGLIHGNWFHDTPRSGVQTKGGSSDVLIHGNRFSDIVERSVNAGGSTDLALIRPIDATHEGARTQIVANLFERPGNTPVAFVGCDTCVFANNTIILPGRYIARILEEDTQRGPGSHGYFLNNLIVFDAAGLSGGFVNVGPGTLPETYVFGWNLWHALDSPGFTGPTYGGGVPAEVSPIIGDAGLEDRDNGNYHLLSTSDAIGAGTTVPRGVPADYDGRVYGDPPDIGAFAAP